MDQNSVYSLDGRLLRIFLLVYELNSVSKAAERLNQTQSTISHSLERLRKALSDPLFVKHGRSITPTAHAQRLVPKIRELLEAMEKLNDLQEYEPGEDTSLVTIAAHAEDLMPELSDLHRTLSDTAPGVALRILPLKDFTETGRVLESGEADLVLNLRRAPYPAWLDHASCFNDRLAIFYDGATRAPVLGIEELGIARHAVLEDADTRTGGLSALFFENGIPLNIALSTASLPLLADLMRNTDMISVLPLRLRNSVMREFATCALPLRLPEQHYDLVWHRRQSHSQRNSWLRQMIVDQLRQNMKPQMQRAS